MAEPSSRSDPVNILSTATITFWLALVPRVCCRDVTSFLSITEKEIVISFNVTLPHSIKNVNIFIRAYCNNRVEYSATDELNKQIK